MAGGKGADYYQFSLFSADETGTQTRPRFQTELDHRAGAQTETLTLPLASLPEGSYVARLQAFGRETGLSTSMIGLYGDTPFRFRRLALTKLRSPAEGTRLDGLMAKRQGVRFVWETPNLPPDATVEVHRAGDNSLVLRSAAAGSSLLMPKVLAGEYWWTVNGSIERFDLSPKGPGHFAVLENSRLPPPENLSPADKTAFGPSQLRSMKSLVLSWSPVEGAQEYVVQGYLEGASQPFVEVHVSGATTVALDKAKTLSARSFCLAGGGANSWRRWSGGAGREFRRRLVSSSTCLRFPLLNCRTTGLTMGLDRWAARTVLAISFLGCVALGSGQDAAADGEGVGRPDPLLGRQRHSAALRSHRSKRCRRRGLPRNSRPAFGELEP